MPLPWRDRSGNRYWLPAYESLPEMIRRIVRQELRPLMEAMEQPREGLQVSEREPLTGGRVDGADGASPGSG